MRTPAGDFASSEIRAEETAPVPQTSVRRGTHNAGETDRGQAKRGQSSHPATASDLLNGIGESGRCDPGEKRRQKHLAQDVHGLGCTSLEPPFVDREPELLRSWSGKISVIGHPRRRGRRAEHDARIIKAGESADRREPGTKPLVRRAAEPGREQHAFQLLRTREMIEHDRRVDEGIIATSRFPVDQPEPFAIEQDVARSGIVVAGDQTGRACIVGFADQFEAFHMGIKQPGGKQTGPPHMREQARDDVGIVDVIREDRGAACTREKSSPSACASARGPPG